MEKGEFTGWIRIHSISGGWGRFQGWVESFSASLPISLLWPWSHLLFPGPLILLATLFSLSSIYSHSRPSFLISREPGKWIKAGSVGGGGRAGTSQQAGIRDLEARLAAHTARVEGLQMAIAFTVIADPESLGMCWNMRSHSFLCQLFLLLVFIVFSKCQWHKANSEYSKTLQATLYPLPFCGNTRIFILTPYFTAWRSLCTYSQTILYSTWFLWLTKLLLSTGKSPSRL